jgi:hypothetical protein
MRQIVETGGINPKRWAQEYGSSPVRVSNTDARANAVSLYAELPSNQDSAARTFSQRGFT